MSRRVRDAISQLRRVFRHRGLRRLELALLGANIGHYSYFVAISLFAYDAGGPAAVGVATVARFVPAAIAAPFAAALADRHSRRDVMVASDLGRALFLGVAALGIAFGAPAAAVIGVAAVASVISTPFEPAKSALLPEIVDDPEQLTSANAASSTIESVSTFVGPALAGVLVAATDPAATLVFSS